MSRTLKVPMFLAALGAVVAVLPAHAQRGFMAGRGPAMGARPHAPFRGAPHGGFLTGPRGRHFNRGFRSGYGGYVYPYYFPDYYPGYYSDYYSQQAPSESPTRVVVVENTQPQPQTPPPPPPESLVLELQGDHWVRITSSGRAEAGAQPEAKGPAKTSALRTIAPQESAALEATRELPPAILVFRDGHQEEISRYTIVGGTIYTNKDYLNNGSWSRKVPMAELNVPATLELNRERGTNFSFPSSPGQIVVRP